MKENRKQRSKEEEEQTTMKTGNETLNKKLKVE